MRLLNVSTMNLEEFEKNIPKYAVLSHTWGSDEVTFREFDPVSGPQRISTKIDGCCAQSLKDGIDYVWIDTCCIDKSSTAELSEAINSMFAWYARAEICYVYLSDVGSGSEQVNQEDDPLDFRKSRWFTRGWTLQELLAPSILTFYNASWRRLGCLAKRGSSKKYRKKGIGLDRLCEATKIPLEIVNGSVPLSIKSIATRMSWASARQTTRVEDMAYCLLGIFDVAMPMIYGEGTKAFTRLQEEIMKNEDDDTIFAWGFGAVGGGTSCFAGSPAAFTHCGDLLDNRSTASRSGHLVMTNKGLNIEMSIIRLATGDFIGQLSMGISVEWLDLAIPLVAIPLDKYSDVNNRVFYRPPTNVPQCVSPVVIYGVSPQPIYVARSTPKLVRWNMGIRLSPDFLREINVSEIHPPNWDLSGGWCLKSPDESLEGEYQMILLGCNNKRGERFVIKVDYKSEIVSGDGPPPSLRPQTGKVSASLLVLPERQYPSLLELVVLEGHGMDKMLDWQEDIALKRVEPSVVESQMDIRDGYTLRLHLDVSDRREWKIDLVNVSDSHIGKSPARTYFVHEYTSDHSSDFYESDYYSSGSGF